MMNKEETYVNWLGQKLGEITKMPCAVCGTKMVVVLPPIMFECPKCKNET